MIFRQERFLREKAAEWHLPPAAQWRSLFYNNYQPHNSTLNLLWFADEDTTPRVVTKIYRDVVLPSREFENLNSAYACAPAWTPKPLHFGFDGLFWTLWMEGVPGLPIPSKGRFSAATLHSMTKALISMHCGMRKASAPGDRADRHRRMVTAPLNTLAGFGSADSVRSGCAALLVAAPEGWLASLPIIPQHGDLYFSHMLANDGKWFVIDWETFGQIDLPVYDLVTLLFSVLRTGGRTPDEWSPAIALQIPELLADYAAALELNPKDIAVLLPLSLANWFYLQWADGRAEFTKWMYQTVQHYFDNRDAWEIAFLPTRKGA
jgi:hypothetical protein